MLALSTVQFTFCRKGLSPFTPLSNSWFPRACKVEQQIETNESSINEGSSVVLYFASQNKPHDEQLYNSGTDQVKTLVIKLIKMEPQTYVQ